MTSLDPFLIQCWSVPSNSITKIKNLSVMDGTSVSRFSIGYCRILIYETDLGYSTLIFFFSYKSATHLPPWHQKYFHSTFTIKTSCSQISLRSPASCELYNWDQLHTNCTTKILSFNESFTQTWRIHMKKKRVHTHNLIITFHPTVCSYNQNPMYFFIQIVI